MTPSRLKTTVGCMLFAVSIAAAQEPAPPPLPPTPAAKPVPLAKPSQAPFAFAPQAAVPPTMPPPKTAPTPAAPKAWFQDGDINALVDNAYAAAQDAYVYDSEAYKAQMKAMGDTIRAQAEQMKQEFKFDSKFSFDSNAVNEQIEKWTTLAQNGNSQVQIFAPQPGRGAMRAPTMPVRALVGRGSTEDRMYESGKSNLDNHRLPSALANFNEVLARGGPRVEGATYYKAFTLNRMGRRDEANAAIAELRKTYPNSRWLEDVKSLEADIKARAGKPAGEDDLNDEDIKLMALDGLMATDPERAFPVLEGLIRGAHIPSLKRQAVFVLAKNQSPRAQTLLEQVARGTVGDPDQQLTALSYMVDSKDKPAHAQLLSDVYTGTTDPLVKRVVISALSRSKDYDRLGQIAKTEKDPDLRRSVINQLGELEGQPQLWAIYGAETTPEGKRMILDVMGQNGNTDKLAEVARTEKDPEVRRAAVRALASHKGPNVTTLMVGIYGNEQDNNVKKTIIGTLADQRDSKALIDLFHKEKDVEMRRSIMSRIINIHSPEVNDFLLETLK